MRRLLSAALVGLLLVSTLSACQSADTTDELTIYSGRSKPLVDSLVAMYRQQTDANVEIRYGTDAQLVNALQEEGDQSPADVYWANTTGALGQATEAGLLTSLPDSILKRPASFAPSTGRWVPVTTRFRVMAYNSSRVDSTDLPASVTQLPQMESLEGRIGWTPTYSSFQDFVTALRTIEGEETALQWLIAMQELNPKSYSSNTPMIQALEAGEIDVALTNHYYVLRLKYGGGEGEYEEEEEGEEEEEAQPRPDSPVETYHFGAGDIGNLALVTGAAQLQTSDQPEEAQRFLRFLLSPEAQRFAATQVNEYPVIPQATVPDYMLPVDQALGLSPALDYDELRDLDATTELMREAGLL
jgi:iron(III) transport system substrate-binding protein